LFELKKERVLQEEKSGYSLAKRHLFSPDFLLQSSLFIFSFFEHQTPHSSNCHSSSSFLFLTTRASSLKTKITKKSNQELSPMMLLSSFCLFILLSSLLVIVTSNQDKEICSIKGSENLRSKMYEETEDTKEIIELERAACLMLAKGELEKLGPEILDENGLLFLDGGDILFGREEQLQMFNAFLQMEGLYFTYDPIEAHVSESKDMAWAYGLYKLQMPGSDKMEFGKYVSVWQKNDGKWLNVAEMRNPYGADNQLERNKDDDKEDL